MKLYDVRAVARFLDVSERRVRQLRDEKVIAEVRPGLYDLIDTNHRYINYLRKRNPEGDETIDYNTERAKLVRAKRKNEEYELQLKENQLHAAEDIEAVMTDMLVNFKSRLTYIGTIHKLGLDIYQYNEWYLDNWTNPNAPTQKPLVPDGTLALLSTEAEYSIYYGAITMIPEEGRAGRLGLQQSAGKRAGPNLPGVRPAVVLHYAACYLGGGHNALFDLGV